MSGNLKIEEKKAFLEHEVGPVMEAMLKDILDTRPVNVVQFIQEWSLMRLQKSQPAPERREHEVTSDSDVILDEQEEIELLKKRQKNKRKPTKKLAISAEAYGEYNQENEFQQAEVPKSAQDQEQIMQFISHSFLFKGLDEKALGIVMRAVSLRDFVADEPVI